jgi:hypothetical protein
MREEWPPSWRPDRTRRAVSTTEQPVMLSLRSTASATAASQIWAAIGKMRALDSAALLTPKDLKLPEWKLFSTPDPAKNSPNMRLSLATPPAKYAPWIESVVLVERLREVQALAGFTRLEASGDDSPAKLAPLRRGRPYGCRQQKYGAKGCSCALRKEGSGVAGGRRNARDAVPSRAPALAIAKEIGAIRGLPRAAVRIVALLVARSDPPVLGGVRICGG